MGGNGEEPESQDEIDILRNEWKKMYQDVLPTAAASAQVRLQVSGYNKNN
jgi:hypothetical protein